MKLTLCFLLATLSLSLAQAQAQAVESDQDLANRFRPFLKTSLDGLSQPEQFHPTTWQWFVQHAQLTGGSKILVPSSGWDAPAFNLLLTKGSDLSQVCQNNGAVAPTCRDSGLELPLDTKTYPNVYNGEDWGPVLAGDGIYAHVERVGPPPRLGLPDTRLINIDYTMIWANNAGRANVNQHDGDVTFLIVLYDPKSDRIVRVTYPAHGCIVQLYELVPGQTAEMQPIDGQSVDVSTTPARLSGNQVNAIQVDVATANISSLADSTLCAVGGAFTRSGDNHIFLVADPASPTLRFEHPAVFVENGTHESWPNSTGRITAGGDHGGKGPSWLPASVVLLGSFASPTSGNTPFLHFNGKFGTDSAPIVLHRSWCWPHNTNWPQTNRPNGECSQNNAGIPDSAQISLFSDLNPYQDFGPITGAGPLNGLANALGTAGTTHWPQVVQADPSDYYAVRTRQAGNGSSAQPFGGLDIAMTFAPAGSTLHLAAGNYPAILLDKPITLQAPAQGVVLGQ